MNVYNKMIEILNNICVEENKKNSNSNVEYEVLQNSFVNECKITDAYFVAKFYNENFCGNADFMHIPNFKQTIDNILNYPIILAREKESKKILGISILKYFESNNTIDPYFPIDNAKYFSVTGILTNIENKNLGFYGIGKKIYEISLKGVLDYKKIDNDIRLMCVIDCRNNHSINALKLATNNLNSKFDIPQINSEYVGYYTVEDQNNKNLLEAPTFVIEMKMDNLSEENFDHNKILIKYDNDSKSKEELYSKIQNTINQNLINDNKIIPTVNIDPECGLVSYYPLLNKCYSLNNIIIDTNNTELGNNRNPIPKDEFIFNLKNDLLNMTKDSIYYPFNMQNKVLVKTK